MRALILAAVLVATPAIAEETAPPGATSQASPGEPMSVWRFGDDGEARHLQSELRCPAAMGEFQRVGMATYNAYGLDVGCGYNSSSVMATLYLTRRGDPRAALEEAKAQLLQAWGARKPQQTTEGPVSLGGLEWLRAQYVLEGGLQSDIWVADLHGWILKYRLTYPPASAESAGRHALAMTELVRGSAGAHLERCGRSAPPVRTGKAVTGRRQREMGLMGALLGGTASVGAEKDAKASEPAVPITFCAERGLQSSGFHMLAWRGVKPDGSDSQVDRLSAMTMGAPPILDVELDALGTVIQAETSGRAAPERWVAKLQDGSRTMIFGYYEGRPTPELVSTLFQRVLDGKAEPLASYSLDGGNVSIELPR